MNGTPTYDELVSEYTELLKTSLSDEGGYNDYTFLQNARFYTALMFLKKDPIRILQIAKQDRQAVEIVLKACAHYVASSAALSKDAKDAIRNFMWRYEDFKKSVGAGSRFKQHPINFQVIFMVAGLKNTYGIAPTKGDETSTKFSGCDIAAAACVNNNLKKPTSYDGVKKVWMNRHKYFPGHASDEELFDALTKDLPTYVQLLALADSK